MGLQQFIIYEAPSHLPLTTADSAISSSRKLTGGRLSQLLCLKPFYFWLIVKKINLSLRLCVGLLLHTKENSLIYTS